MFTYYFSKVDYTIVVQKLNTYKMVKSMIDP